VRNGQTLSAATWGIDDGLWVDQRRDQAGHTSVCLLNYGHSTGLVIHICFLRRHSDVEQ
jgi:hypothetical protein